MRRFKTIFTVVFASLFAFGIHAQETGQEDLSAYYGFKEIEIIKLDWGILDLQIADFNGDGRNDMAIANNRKARIELLLQKEGMGPDEIDVAVDPGDVDVNAIVPPTRFARESIAVSQKLFSLVCGDLNSDGLVDMAFYGEPRGLYILLQKTEPGKRDSLSWQTRKKIQIDDGLLTSNALGCADLNHDGADDLALAGRDAVYIVVQKKDGTLAEPEKYPTSAQTLGVEVGDLNSDGINDLILVTNDGEKPLHVRFGLKTGKFGPLQRFFIERPSALTLHATDETDGDKILVVDSVSGRLICYKLSTEDRQGADWPILFYPLASGQEDTKRDLAVGDFNGDGLADVVISDPGAAEITFYKQAAKIGLAEPVRFPAFADITSLSAMDIDGDSRTELGVLSVKEKVIGLSKFENDRLSFPQPVDLTGEPLAMELANIDGDGITDCIYVSKEDNDARTLRVIHNVALTQNGSSDSTDVKLIALAKLTSNPDGLKVLDVDQDGLQDVLIFVSYEAPLLVRQVQKGQFDIVDSPEAQSSLIKDAGLRSIALANVDGKTGDELLVAQKNFARSLIFSEGRTWTVIDQYNADSPESQISAVGAFDIGAESATDTTAIFLLDGQKGRLQMLKAGDDKTYRIERRLDVGTWSNAVHLKMLYAPLTGGGAKSLLLFDSAKFALITPSSDGVQQLDQQFSYETKIKDGLYGRLAAGNINSDGRSDIIMVEHAQNHIEILTLDADAKPIPAMRFKIFEEKSYRDSKPRPKVGAEPREMTVADVTGDGKDDLVTVIHDRIIIYPQD